MSFSPAPSGASTAGSGGRQFVHVVGQEGEHRAELVEGVAFVFGFVVDAA